MLLLAGLGIQGSQTTMAVGHAWAHAECLGQGASLRVMGFGLRGIGGVGVGLDNTQLARTALATAPALYRTMDMIVWVHQTAAAWAQVDGR